MWHSLVEIFINFSTFQLSQMTFLKNDLHRNEREMRGIEQQGAKQPTFLCFSLSVCMHIVMKYCEMEMWMVDLRSYYPCRRPWGHLQSGRYFDRLYIFLKFSVLSGNRCTRVEFEACRIGEDCLGLSVAAFPTDLSIWDFEGSLSESHETRTKNDFRAHVTRSTAIKRFEGFGGRTLATMSTRLGHRRPRTSSSEMFTKEGNLKWPSGCWNIQNPHQNTFSCTRSAFKVSKTKREEHKG